MDENYDDNVEVGLEDIDNDDCTDDVFIHMIQKYSVIYDKSNEKHKDARFVENAWTALADCIGIEVDVARNTWARLKRKYVRHRKLLSDPPRSGSAATTTSKWELYHSMVFLEKHVATRKSCGNKIVKKRCTSSLSYSSNLWNEAISMSPSTSQPTSSPPILAQSRPIIINASTSSLPNLSNSPQDIMDMRESMSENSSSNSLTNFSISSLPYSLAPTPLRATKTLPPLRRSSLTGASSACTTPSPLTLSCSSSNQSLGLDSRPSSPNLRSPSPSNSIQSPSCKPVPSKLKSFKDDADVVQQMSRAGQLMEVMARRVENREIDKRSSAPEDHISAFAKYMDLKLHTFDPVTVSRVIKRFADILHEETSRAEGQE